MPKRERILTYEANYTGSYNDKRVRVHLWDAREPDRRNVLELTPEQARDLRDFLDRALSYEPPPWLTRQGGRERDA